MLHQISLGRRDFLNAESSKHDYDWLKTPPATPLFPSIEMEASQANPVLCKDIALLHPLVPSRFKGKAEEAEAQAPKSPGAKSTSSSKSATSTARSKQSNSGSNVCKRPTNNTHASSLPKSRAPLPILGFSDKPPANLVATTCKVFSITRSSKPESAGKPRKQQPCSRSGRDVEKNPKAKNENSGWRTNVGFGKFRSRGLNDNDEHKHKDVNVKNTETNHLNPRQVKNSHPVCVLPRKDSSHLAPNKQVQNCGRQSEKFNPKAGKKG
ncbi:uncharacterized protein LOC122007861 [Zingiber officinale]|uniref:uncharacterized protein LOC122007861 n=1 Tax=Zingiber officinale TaxID=94328 RepID=UPI001C4D7DF6|nr:uncharacterized protein LOC122007861 [Zingiber officinale]